jgi:hypothetical protein
MGVLTESISNLRIPGQSPGRSADRMSLIVIPGDVALALSFPILWFRLYHIGPIGTIRFPDKIYSEPDTELQFSTGQGVSLETQILLFITFLARYAYPGSFSLSLYNAIMKGWLLGASVLSVLGLMLAFRWAIVTSSHSISFLIQHV